MQARVYEKLKLLSIFPSEGVNHQGIRIYHTLYFYCHYIKLFFHLAYWCSFEKWLGKIGKNGQVFPNKWKMGIEINYGTQIVNYLC